ncbi:hypothetical protein WG66_001276, partial [Moniliophthora roreri]
MFKSSFALFLTLAVSGSASASLVTRNPLSTLVAKQNSIQTNFDPSLIPEQCQTQCAATVGDIQRCSRSFDRLCGCSTTDVANLRECLNCFASLVPGDAGLQSDIQDIYDDYVQGCNNAKGILPSASIAGGTNPTSTRATSGDDRVGSSTHTRTTVSSEKTGSSSNSNVPGSANSDNSAANIRRNWAVVSGVGAALF